MERKKYYTYSFEKLDVWKMAREVRNRIYEITRGFPNCEKYGLTSQLRRSLNGITDNLAEGSGRASSSDRAHFTNMAYSSALESINQLISCHDQKYIDTDLYEELRTEMDQVINKLNSFYKYQLNKGKSVKEQFRKT